MCVQVNNDYAALQHCQENSIASVFPLRYLSPRSLDLEVFVQAVLLVLQAPIIIAIQHALVTLGALC